MASATTPDVAEVRGLPAEVALLWLDGEAGVLKSETRRRPDPSARTDKAAENCDRDDGKQGSDERYHR